MNAKHLSREAMPALIHLDAHIDGHIRRAITSTWALASEIGHIACF